ncbi:MAG: hypothetical protein C0506_01940 [Anaerolinea sp.]|nr:hypothetical protein [Anaerolinea sp.]
MGTRSDSAWPTAYTDPMTLAERLYTPEELLELEDGEAFELDDGVLREVPVGFKSEAAAITLIARLLVFLEKPGNGIGQLVPPGVGLQIFPGRPRRVPRADGGYISFGRLPRGGTPDGFLTVAPELLIESISPGDHMEYMNRKIAEYLSAGVSLVWVLFPLTRTAHIYRAEGTVTIIPSDGALDGEDVIPGFRCALADIMPPAETA